MQAFFINDSGRIAGVGVYNGVSQWFIMDLVGPNNNNPPVAVAGPDQTVSCDKQANLDGSGSHDPDNDPLTYEWSANGSVLGTTVTLSPSFPIGKTVVTLKVTDPCGASDTANLTVTVVDTNAPTGSCPPPVTVSADSTCQAAVPNFVPQVVASDNCTPAESLVITQDIAPGTLLGLGQHTVTITVRDLSGNASTCPVLFTVVDTTPPTITVMPAPFTVSVGSDCQAQMPNMLGSVKAMDSCTSADMLVKSQNPAAGTLLGVGGYTLTVTVKDAAGNPATATVNFNVADTTAPTIQGGPARTVSTDSNCQGTVPNMFDGFLLLSDNCTPANQLVTTQSPAAGAKLLAGSYPVTVTATDLAGNTSMFVVQLVVADTTAPTIQGGTTRTVSTDSNCQGTVPNMFDGFLLLSDNCTSASQLVTTQSPAAGTKLSAGSYPVTVTATDLAGNTSTFVVQLVVAATTPPVIQALSVSPNVLTPPNHQLVPVTVSAVVTDGCDTAPVAKIVSITTNDGTSPGDITITGNLTALLAASKTSSGGTRVYTITVQATDASGNSSTAQVTVTVPKSNGSSTGGTAQVKPKH